MKIGDKVKIKLTGIKGIIIGQNSGLWLVQFPNGGKSTYPTNKLTKL
jgi:hypothetical protein